ncbi:MAG: two-component regulator propeller domain-containing protein [Saprospiraceae bacterium]|nr:two-component regulator propeller domain-containing protein [Saprospiraceae bacterium]
MDFRVSLTLTLLAGFLVDPAIGQSDLRIGQWRSHFAYNEGISVTQDDDKVYYAARTGLFAVRKADMSVEFFSKVDGLSEVEASLIRYHPGRDVLVVIYTNSNVDLVFPSGVFNISDILENNNIVGSKAINDVYVGLGRKIYFSCDFGLVEFDLETRKFGFTMFTGTPVSGFTEFDGSYYLSTGQGLYRYSGAGIAPNFGAWEQLGDGHGLPAGAPSQGVVVYENQLFAAVDHALYAWEEDAFLLWDLRDGHYIEFMSPEGQHLKVGFRCFEDACNGKVHFYTVEGKVGEHGFDCAWRPLYAIEDEEGRVWYADEQRGPKYAGNYLWGCFAFDFNTPWSNNVNEIAVKDGTVFVAAGGVSDTYNNRNYPDGFYILDQNDWSFFNRTNEPLLAQQDILDYLRILPHPDSQYVYIGSYYAGLIRFDLRDSTYRFYDQDNSLLQGAVGDSLRERIAGMAMDAAGTLWMSCFLAPRPIVAMTADGQWANFAVPSGTRLADVVIDRRGYKWFAIISASEGLLVFDDNGTIDNPADDRYAMINTSNSNLPTNLLTNLAVDRDGDIWVGTSQGPVVFDAATDPFAGPAQGFRVTVEQDGILSYLLEEEQITSIAVDGANRKWFGTRNGIFVQSPAGDEEIARFNESNSPLPNNIITDIAINHENGDVYIGTQSGLVSMRTDAVRGRPFHNVNAYAFPNPVRPEYDGPIAIKGLAEDAAVKITDMAGTVVFETRALGGQAIWDGTARDGQRAQTGVYLVFSTTEPQFDKPDALVTKILLVN